jgi:hypothetical protein
MDQWLKSYVSLEMPVKSLAKKLLSVGRALGPYVAIELLLPGGSLVAVALWLYRTHCFSRARSAR